MKLQPASKQEIRRISLGTAVGDCLLVLVLFLLSQFGIGTFTFLRILLGVLGGSVVAILNFTIMCLTIQKAVDIADKKMKAKIQVSYNFRMLIQGVWCVVALVVPGIHVIAGVTPLLFPTLTIYYLQAKGKLVTPSERKNPENLPDEEEDIKGSFEI